MFRKRKGIIVMYEYMDKDGGHIKGQSFITSSDKTYADMFDELYEDLKDINNGQFNIYNVVKLIFEEVY